MNCTLIFFSIAIFSIFLGSQITEGCLMVPHWKSLTSNEFYEYYAEFGLIIGRFYSILTAIAALTPICISIYCFYKRSKALSYSLISSVFSFLFIAVFFVYFKEANQQFLDASLNPIQLKSELEAWEYWHWLRVLFEFLSLGFLIFSLNILSQNKRLVETNQAIRK